MIYYTSKAKEVVIPEGISGSMPDEGGLKASNIKKGVVILGVTGTLTGGGGDVTVIDSLDSSSATDALSANQGRVLNEKITAEVTQRQADTEYLTGKDTELTNMITNEANDRIADVTNVELAISNEETERKAADVSLQGNIDKEAEARATAVSDEAAERLEQDTQLSTRIDQEVNDRKAACGILQTNIDTEASTRSSEDTRLEELIRSISPGTQGLEGPQGAIGTQGVIGTQGHQGNIGQRGTIGLEGPQGAIGTMGPQGSMGTRGPQGVQGTYGTIGPQGVQGVQGIMGVQGPQGVKGAAGLDGLPGAQGTIGTIGTQGYKGDQGDKGTQGDKGIQGDVGPQGPQGASGGGSGTTINVIDNLESSSATDALSANQGRVIIQEYVSNLQTQISNISNADYWEFTTEDGNTYIYLVRCQQR